MQTLKLYNVILETVLFFTNTKFYVPRRINGAKEVKEISLSKYDSHSRSLFCIVLMNVILTCVRINELPKQLSRSRILE